MKNLLLFAAFLITLSGCKEGFDIEKNLYFNENEERIIKINEKTIASKRNSKTIMENYNNSFNLEILNDVIFFLDPKTNYLKKIEKEEISIVIPIKIEKICVINKKIVIESNKNDVDIFLKNNEKIIKNIIVGKCENNINENDILKNENLLISSSKNEDNSVFVDLYYNNYKKYKKDEGRLIIVMNYISDGIVENKEYEMSLDLREMINLNDNFNYNKINGEIKNNNGILSFRISEKIYIINFYIENNNLKIKDVKTIEINNNDVIFKEEIEIKKISEINGFYAMLLKIKNKDILIELGSDGSSLLMGDISEFKVDTNKCNILVKTKKTDIKLISTCN